MPLRPTGRHPLQRGPFRIRALSAPLVGALLLAGLLAPSPVSAQALTGFQPRSLDQTPPGFRFTPRRALAIADRQPVVVRERASHPRLRSELVVPEYFGDHRYEVTYLDGDDVRVDVHIGGKTARVIELWTGPQADTLLARGYDPPIGRSLNSPFVWLPLALLFLLPFADPRRLRRLIHLDLLVLLGFGVSQLYFNRGEIDVSVPLVYPLLAYLLARMLWGGLRSRGSTQRLLPLVRPSWLVVGLVLLIAFRIGFDVVDSRTIDVGRESVFGADRILHGEPLYGTEGHHGDTYGPVAYLAYVPFVAVFPADGPSGYDYAARAAAISFDLLVIVALLLLGMRLRAGREGRVLGVALAYAWAAYPFSLLALQTNANDALIAALVLFALLAVESPAGRGMLLGLAGAAKFVPLALVPLLARGRGRGRIHEVHSTAAAIEGGGRTRLPSRDTLVFAATLLAVLAAATFGFLPDGGPRELYDATIGYQLGRESPFSIWGLHHSLDWLQTTAQIAVVIGATALSLVPRERSVRQLAALSTAVLIATQLTATYWFYTYLVWFTPLALIAVFGAYAVEAQAAEDEAPVVAATKPLVGV
jgi:hypothetical protein